MQPPISVLDRDAKLIRPDMRAGEGARILRDEPSASIPRFPGRLAVAGSELEDIAKLLLRITLGSLLLLHGIAKLQGGIDFILDAVAKTGQPAALGYLVFVGEIAAPVLLLVGVWTRAAALVIAINMVVAVALVHGADLWLLSPSGGGWALELQAFYLASALAVALLGAGRYATGNASGRWN